MDKRVFVLNLMCYIVVHVWQVGPVLSVSSDNCSFVGLSDYRKEWTLCNRFRTGLGIECNKFQRCKWLIPDLSCDFGAAVQTMAHKTSNEFPMGLFLLQFEYNLVRIAYWNKTGKFINRYQVLTIMSVLLIFFNKSW